MSTYRRLLLNGLLGIAFLTFLATAVAQDQTAKDIENLNAQVQDLVRQFRIDEALPLAERALEGTRKLRLTKENSGVLLSSLVNLAGIETARGKFDKAEELCSEFLPILRKVLPPSLYEMVAALEAYVRTGALFQNGRVTEARLLAEQTLTKVRVLSLPPGIANPILAPSLELLAQIYFALERFDDAEKLFNEELPVLREAPQEPLSPDAVTVLAASARAHALYQKGKILDALSLAKNTLRDAEAWPPSQGKNLGVAYGLIGLADLYSGLGRYDDADQLYIQALPLIKNLLPNGSPLAAVGITEANVRAQVMVANGNVADAISLAKDSLRNSKQIAEESPQVTTCLDTLALIYETVGRYKDAEKLWIEELALLRKQLGEHPYEARCLADLGGVYDYEARYNEAESSYGEVIEIWKKFHFEEHPSMAEAVGNLGHLYYSEGRFGDAESRFDEARAMWAKLGIKEHPALATCLNNLGALYFAQSRFQDAERLFGEVQEMLDRLGYKNHPFAAALMSNRANVYHAQGRDEEAEPLYRAALEMFRNLGIEEHPYRAQCLNNLALLFQEQHDYKKEAEKYYVEALSIWNHLLPQHPDSAIVLSNLGSLYLEQRQFAKAKQLYLDALAIWQKRLPGEHPEVAIGLNNLAFLYYAQRQYLEAEPLYRQALKIWRASLPNDHLLLAGGLQNLALVVWASQSSSKGSLEEVSQLLRESTEIRIAVLGRELNRAAGITSVKDNFVRVLRFEGASADLALSFAVRPQGLPNNAETAKTALLEEWAQKGRAQEEARQQGQQPQPLKVNDARLQLPKGAALLEFAIYRDLRPEMTNEEVRDSERHYAACILRWDRDDPACLDLGSANRIERDTEDFLRQVRDPTGNSVLSHVFTSLWPTLEPLLSHLNGIERLFVAEDGALNGVPLQAMKTQTESFESWGDRFEITYLNSGRDLLWHAGEQAATGPAVVAGLNSYGLPPQNRQGMRPSEDKDACPDQSSAFRTLSQAEPMALLAARRFGVEKPLIGPAATEENLKKAVNAGPAPRAVVLVLHGCVKEGGHDEESELRLVIGDGKGGWVFLPASDVARWHLQGSALYVLACWAGSPVGKLVGDLRQAATLAGVRYLVAPLWRVPQDAAFDFLDLLLKEEQKGQKGQSPAAALRAAQESMRKMSAYKHPYYWAGYTVNGVGATETTADSVKASQPKPNPATTSNSRDSEKQPEVEVGGAKGGCAGARSLAIDANSHESFYLGIRFGNGSADSIHLSNKEKNQATVKVERYSANGCLQESVEKTIPAGGNAEVRIGDSVQELCPQYGWIRVVSKGKGITVSDTQEVIRGDRLVSVERGQPSSRSPAGRFANRWVESLADKPDLAYFLNLSEDPVRVGMCQSDRRNFSCGALDHTVAPMEQVGFNIDHVHHYLVIESTPGSSVAASVKMVDGNTRVFDVTTNLTFGNVVPGTNAAGHSPRPDVGNAERQKQIDASTKEAKWLYENGYYDDSVAAYQNALKVDPDNPELLQGLYRACDARVSKPEVVEPAVAATANAARLPEPSKSATPAVQTPPPPHIPQPQDWVGDWESAAPATWDTNCYSFSSKKPSTAKENLRFQVVSVDASGQVQASFVQHQVSPSPWTGQATATRLLLAPPSIPKGTLLPDLTNLVEQTGRIELRREGNGYSAVFFYKLKEHGRAMGIRLFTCEDNGSFAGPIRHGSLLSLNSAGQAPPGPWTKDQITRMLRDGILPDHVEALARRRGIDFPLTSDVESELRRAGANDSLITALKEVASAAPRLASPTQQESLESIESGAPTDVAASDKQPVALAGPDTRTTAEYFTTAFEQKGDVGPFKVLHDHSVMGMFFKSFAFKDDPGWCDGSMGIRGNTVWFRSDNQPRHSFSIPISQIREIAREGLSGVITVRLSSGKKYKFYADAEAAQKFVSRVQSPSK